MTSRAILSRRGLTRRRLRTLAVVLAGFASAASVTVLVLDGTRHHPTGLAAEVPACADGVPVTPASNLAALVSQRQAGTCFLLAAGTYQFHDIVPKDRMAFVGVGTASVIVTGPGQENAFHGMADGVVIGQMTFRGFTGSGGTSAQEQAPIRGTNALWESNRGRLATNWLVSDVISEGNLASGIFIGDNWTVRNSIFRNNGVTGIGGDSLVGGLIEANIINDNGINAATGAASNGAGIKLTQAGTQAQPVVVRNNEVFANHNEGVWCDLGCNGMQVLDNYIHDHLSRGVMYELSSHLEVRGNTIRSSNTWTSFAEDFNAGAVTIGESADAVVENNRIQQAEAGVIVRQTKRPYTGENLTAYADLTWVSANVTVRNNILDATRRTGISTGATGRNLITNPASIVYTGNTYQNPPAGGMQFWWNNGASMTFDQWKAAGRDTVAQGAQPGSPETSVRGPRPASAGTTTTSTTAAPTTTTTAAPTTTAVPTTALTTSESTTTTTAPPTSESTTTTTAPAVESTTTAAPTTTTVTVQEAASAGVIELPFDIFPPTPTVAPSLATTASTPGSAEASASVTATPATAAPTTPPSTRRRPRKLARWILRIPNVGDYEVTVSIRPLKADQP